MIFEVSPRRFLGLTLKLSIFEGNYRVGLRVRGKVLCSAGEPLRVFDELGEWALTRGVRCHIFQSSSQDSYRFALWLDNDAVASEFLLAWVFDEVLLDPAELAKLRQQMASIRRRTLRVVEDAVVLKRVLMRRADRVASGSLPFPHWRQTA